MRLAAARCHVRHYRHRQPTPQPPTATTAAAVLSPSPTAAAAVATPSPSSPHSRRQLPPATLQIRPRGADLGDTAAAAGHRAVATTSPHGTTTTTFALAAGSIPATIAIPAAFSRRRPASHAPAFAVAIPAAVAAVLPAASRRPARSGRSGLDLAVTVVPPGGSPARSVRGQRGALPPPSLRPASFAGGRSSGGEAEGKKGRDRGGRVVASRTAQGRTTRETYRNYWNLSWSALAICTY
ncbi:Os12g0640132 [Oryza sativa Japonica Group]|uniref:Os12g0640132 protein n=1 Tax=Oryza sativa subsp. japonica TaxID=39947 RepID=A0A0P0YDM7_ORYSJ|nr:Os12g0640132 [Oryza sativa Japonica Group]